MKKPKPAAKEKLAVLKHGLIFPTHSLLNLYKSESTVIAESRFDNSAINNQRRFPVSSGNAFFV